MKLKIVVHEDDEVGIDSSVIDDNVPGLSVG